MDSHERLQADHAPDAIARRIRASTDHSYLGDGVLGAIDGTVTTFAIVAASSGAGLSSGVALVLGFANVVADGFSMAASNYMKAKADREVIQRARRDEEHHIEHIPDGEREEIRQIFRNKGFTGDVLEQIVETITQDRDRWLDTMLTEELGLPLETPWPARAGVTTFVAFLMAGLIPLIALWVFRSFPASAVTTAVTFFLIGVLKARVTGERLLTSGIETLVVGGGAAVLAYIIAFLTKGLAA
ncbi:MAG: VIT1/CCC1 transporter family protein [Planctomycetota bacterium]|jgi:VIT1/CCC1 family predicted Fe2+/Mn2+ transporter